MRFIGGLIVFVIAVVAFRWCAGEIGLQVWGAETRAHVTNVSKSSVSGRRSSYTARYEFVTEDMSKGYGSCPSHRGAEGSGVNIRYFRHDPDWNTPRIWWYAGFWILLFGVGAWLFALWSARTFLYQKVLRFGETEEDEDDAEDEVVGGEEAEKEGEKTAEMSPKKMEPAPDALPVPFRNTWLAAILFSSVLSAAAIVLNLGWFSTREKSFASVRTAQPVAETTDTLTRGTSAGNASNGSDLGFDSETLYFGLWRDYNNPASAAPGLYRFALDGSGRTPVGDLAKTEGIFAGVQVQGDWIYYIAMQGIGRIRKDGSRHKLLTKDNAGSMAVVGDWIYYQHKILDGAIYRMLLDGSGEKRLCRESVGVMCVADNGWIYYCNKTDGERLWCMKADGSDRVRLADRRIGKLLVAGGSIWFTDPERNSALCRMDLTGAGGETIFKYQVSAISWADGWVYFVRSSGQAVRCKPDGTELQVVAPLAMSILIHGDFVYVRPDFEAKGFRRSKLDGSEPLEFRLE